MRLAIKKGLGFHSRLTVFPKALYAGHFFHSEKMAFAPAIRTTKAFHRNTGGRNLFCCNAFLPGTRLHKISLFQAHLWAGKEIIYVPVLFLFLSEMPFNPFLKGVQGGTNINVFSLPEPDYSKRSHPDNSIARKFCFKQISSLQKNSPSKTLMGTPGLKACPVSHPLC